MTKFDWNQMREDIVARVRAATTAAEREAGLTLYQQSMDAVERAMERQGLPNNDIEQFKEARRKEYYLLLIEECRLVQPAANTEKGLLDPATMGAITTREVLAGRMHPDDGFHKVSIAGARILTTPVDTKALSGHDALRTLLLNGDFRRAFAKIRQSVLGVLYAVGSLIALILLNSMLPAACQNIQP